MQTKSNMEQAEIFVFIASFFLIALGVKEPEKPPQQPLPKQDLPPIILFPESSKFKFPSGRAELSPDFKSYIHSQLGQEILKITKEHNVDAIEVIGHTDGQPISGIESNLDNNLEKVNLGLLPMSKLQAASNTDLGIMRALAVVQELKNSGEEIAKLNFRAYSAGQLLLEDGSPAPTDKADIPERRRIEIRFTKLGKTQRIK
ncbi:MAG: flagellar motor protein [Snowella sp.]|nr:flagellar motor protein [Snowella sp.]